ncbi:hypothetical protein RI129_000365 [Pyrocoelia pectoralis]|uniref:Uncharacterized protein n=1 Tax=Pyrocoelia pectoralis TaxID=417401 RepID=A0AAN7VS54_9COLE
MTRMDLFNILSEGSLFGFLDKKHREDFVYRVLEITHAPPHSHSRVKHSLSLFLSEVQKKWKKSNRHRRRFLKANKEWLGITVHLNFETEASTSGTPTDTTSKYKRGRPRKLFSESSDRSKRRKTASLRREIPENELQFAAQMKLRAEGKVDAARVIKDITLSPQRASTFRRAYKKRDFDIPKLPTDRALALMVEAGLSKNQYNLIRAVTKEIGCDVFPSYNQIIVEKSKCHPDLIVTDTKGEVKVQDLLDHTTGRILDAQEEVLKSHNIAENLHLISKWGCDGSTGSVYKQRFANATDTDQYTFLTSLVPLRLVDESNGNIIWQNPNPSSIRYFKLYVISNLHIH